MSRNALATLEELRNVYPGAITSILGIIDVRSSASSASQAFLFRHALGSRTPPVVLASTLHQVLGKWWRASSAQVRHHRAQIESLLDLAGGQMSRRLVTATCRRTRPCACTVKPGYLVVYDNLVSEACLGVSWTFVKEFLSLTFYDTFHVKVKCHHIDRSMNIKPLRSKNGVRSRYCRWCTTFEVDEAGKRVVQLSSTTPPE